MILNQTAAPISVLRKIATNLYDSFKLLDPVNRWHIDMFESDPESYDVCEGVFARGLHRASADTFRGAAFTSVAPENWRETEVQQQIYEDFRMDIKIFFFHPSQDLLILMERPSAAYVVIERIFTDNNLIYNTYSSARVHFREYRSLVPHPLAAKEAIEITNPYGEAWEECLIEIRDNVLVGYFFNYSENLNRGMACAWDWTTGTMLMVCQV
jgi:hypothetical protein